MSGEQNFFNMEATELRLNNLVIYQDEIVPIMGIENNDKGLLVKLILTLRLMKRSWSRLRWLPNGFQDWDSKRPTDLPQESDTTCQTVADMTLTSAPTRFCKDFYFSEITSNAIICTSCRTSISRSRARNSRLSNLSNREKL